MNFDELYRTMREWDNDLDRYQKISSLSQAFMACDTNGEVNQVVNANIEFLNDNPGCWRMARDARKRITRLRRASMEAWKNQLN